METRENIVGVTPIIKKHKTGACKSATKKDTTGRMSVEEYIALVRKALDKQYEEIENNVGVSHFHPYLFRGIPDHPSGSIVGNRNIFNHYKTEETTG